jgi:hypothetical protein
MIYQTGSRFSPLLINSEQQYQTRQEETQGGQYGQSVVATTDFTDNPVADGAHDGRCAIGQTPQAENFCITRWGWLITLVPFGRTTYAQNARISARACSSVNPCLAIMR